jgi:hypothetical protein
MHENVKNWHLSEVPLTAGRNPAALFSNHIGVRSNFRDFAVIRKIEW